LFVPQAEAVTESLKNILLVMFASGLLVRPTSQQAESSKEGEEANPSVATWNITWKTIDGFCPTLKNEFLLKVCSYGGVFRTVSVQRIVSSETRAFFLQRVSFFVKIGRKHSRLAPFLHLHRLQTLQVKA
jgi:hypothetical protein